jgi:hypothetical protein
VSEFARATAHGPGRELVSVVLLLSLVMLAGLQAEAPEVAAPAQEFPLSLRVNHAITLGVEYLKGLQRPNGTFPTHEADHPGGATALAAYTLLRSGVRKDDAVIVKALGALAGNEFKSTYSASLHLLLCEALREPARAAEAQRSLDLLIDNQDNGAWAYPWGNPDNSNTQFALLALRSARRMGLEVPEGVLIEALEGLAVFARGDGGYAYGMQLKETYAGMTAATLASIGVLQEAAPEHARLRAALERESRRIDEAVHWMELRFDPARNANGDGTWRSIFHYAYLWALERWCGLTGRERIAGRDWYSEGALWLLSQQGQDGSFGLERDFENTCFALLFLRRATLSPSDELAAVDAKIERARREQLERVRRPRADALRLTEFWLAGPFVQNGRDPILMEPPFDPADVAPRARGKLGREEWKRVTLGAKAWTDLDALGEEGREDDPEEEREDEREREDEGERQMWVLATWLRVEGPEPATATLWFEFQEGWDVWLDGQRLTRERRRNSRVLGDVFCPLQLAPGEHLLTVLLEDLKGPAAFGARLDGGSGGPPPAGLSVSAEPASAKKK